MPASEVTVALAGPVMLFCRRVSATMVAHWNTPNAAASATTPRGCCDSAPAAINTAPAHTKAANAVDPQRATRPAARPPADAPAQMTTISSETSAAVTPPLSISSGVYSSSAPQMDPTTATRMTAARTEDERRVSLRPALKVSAQPRPASSCGRNLFSGNNIATNDASTQAATLAAPTAANPPAATTGAATAPEHIAAPTPAT